MPLSGDPFPRPHRGGQGTMDDAVEASAQRVRNHLRRPFPGGRNLLMETAGNTVSEIVPQLINFRLPLTLRSKSAFPNTSNRCGFRVTATGAGALGVGGIKRFDE